MALLSYTGETSGTTIVGLMYSTSTPTSLTLRWYYDDVSRFVHVEKALGRTRHTSTLVGDRIITIGGTCAKEENNKLEVGQG